MIRLRPRWTQTAMLLPDTTLFRSRLQDVLRYIELHLSEPKLCIGMVAKGCGISPRYLSFLLKLHGTPFSTLIWDKRLESAGRWLSSSTPAEASISEVAYKVGLDRKSTRLNSSH